MVSFRLLQVLFSALTVASTRASVSCINSSDRQLKDCYIVTSRVAAYYDAPDAHSCSVAPNPFRSVCQVVSDQQIVVARAQWCQQEQGIQQVWAQCTAARDACTDACSTQYESDAEAGDELAHDKELQCLDTCFSGSYDLNHNYCEDAKQSSEENIFNSFCETNFAAGMCASTANDTCAAISDPGLLSSVSSPVSTLRTSSLVTTFKSSFSSMAPTSVTSSSAASIACEIYQAGVAICDATAGVNTAVNNGLGSAPNALSVGLCTPEVLQAIEYYSVITRNLAIFTAAQAYVAACELKGPLGISLTKAIGLTSKACAALPRVKPAHCKRKGSSDLTKVSSPTSGIENRPVSHEERLKDVCVMVRRLGPYYQTFATGARLKVEYLATLAGTAKDSVDISELENQAKALRYLLLLCS